MGGNYSPRAQTASSSLKEPRAISTLAAWPAQALVHLSLATHGSLTHHLARLSLFHPLLPTQLLDKSTL
jgi:hypothetical protein